MNEDHRYRKHYTREEARTLLPQIRQWLTRIGQLREELSKHEQQFESVFQAGGDAGGATVNSWLRGMADLRELFLEFHRREIQIKDLSRGLIDFPAIIAGREVFLCWEKDEEDMEFWHDLDAGYAGRERLSGMD
jgi:hypothetical protein